MCDLRTWVGVRDAGQIHPAPTITFYDRVAEGLGLAERLYELHDELLSGALELVESCGCQEGCPACVGPSGVGGGEIKLLTVRLLRAVSGVAPRAVCAARRPHAAAPYRRDAYRVQASALPGRRIQGPSQPAWRSRHRPRAAAPVTKRRGTGVPPRPRRGHSPR
jgi:ATP-dependent helicase YprA (DUF1998 family)